MESYEKLGMFYLGKPLDSESRELKEEYLLYRSNDLCTHAICVGMTGSGKTGLCVGLLEEAAIDGVPALVIDPKGDMSNLCLSFDQLRGADLEPWVQAEEAKSRGLSTGEFAEAEAKKWREGLAEWGQNPERVRLMRQNCDITVYTPGSNLAEALSIIDLFSLPPEQTLNDSEALADLLSGTSSSLLGLLGMEADPLTSREHILIANILSNAWQQGRSLDLAGLISQIQRPPFSTVGILNLEAFYPEKDRFDLALRFNNLLASPGFSGWLEGQPLNIDRLLYTESGKPRIAVISIAHLSESWRMFFVSLLLNQLLAWTRRQSGTGSLRAILYMDEIYGYFPPVKNPPSKQPLITLLKQARAYGLSVVLTTQNPVDLDYKGLSNMGTWFVGRLQTEGDKARLLDGLAGAAQEAGQGFPRAEMDKILSSLGKRCFLMNNVHETQPTLFTTRWTLSYLRGPMTRAEIKQLKDLGLYDKPLDAAAPRRAIRATEVTDDEPAPLSFPAADSGESGCKTAAPAAETRAATVDPTGREAALQSPPGIPVYYMAGRGARGRYQPCLAAYSEIFYKGKDGQNIREEDFRLVEIGSGTIPVHWNESEDLDLQPNDLGRDADESISYAELPPAGRKKENYANWEKDLQDYLYRNKSFKLFSNPKFKVYSRPEETERDFIIRIGQETREQRDRAIEALKDKYSRRLATASEKVRKAGQAVDREESQAKEAKRQSAISIGSTVLSVLLGGKINTGALGRAATAGRGLSRASQASGDINRAEDTLKTYQDDLEQLNTQLEEELQRLSEEFEAKLSGIESVELRPLKQDVRIKFFALCWREV